MPDANPVIETDAELAYVCCVMLHGREIAKASGESRLIFGILEQAGLMELVEGRMQKTKRILDVEVMVAAANG